MKVLGLASDGTLLEASTRVGHAWLVQGTMPEIDACWLVHWRQPDQWYTFQIGRYPDHPTPLFLVAQVVCHQPTLPDPVWTMHAWNVTELICCVDVTAPARYFDAITRTLVLMALEKKLDVTQPCDPPAVRALVDQAYRMAVTALHGPFREVPNA